MVSFIWAHVKEIWKDDERYGKREMRDMKRYGMSIYKERNFYCNISSGLYVGADTYY